VEPNNIVELLPQVRGEKRTSRPHSKQKRKRKKSIPNEIAQTYNQRKAK